MVRALLKGQVTETGLTLVKGISDHLRLLIAQCFFD